MKKLISISVIAVLVLSITVFAGCSETIDNTSSDTASVSSEKAESPDNADSGFEDFAAYMSDNGYIKGKGEEITASVIGANYGERYTISSNGSKIYVELYEYTDSESELAAKTLNEAKNSGTFTLYDGISTEHTVAAVSADGKYLMLYTDSSTSGSNVQTKNDAVEAVKSYGK